jgi:protein-S-isoprenylcysteine O-methyltransferase Ste14
VFAVGPFILLILARPSLRCWLVGIPLVLLGQGIRFWAAGHLRKNATVISSGPFGYVRNPLYLGSFFIFCGLCAMVNRWVIFPLLIFIFIIFHVGAVLYEERHLHDLFGEEFSQYCKRVPRFIPRLRSIGGAGKFSFHLAIINREHKSALGTLVLVVLFGLRILFSSMKWIP